MAKDYYAILGVEKNATQDEIKKAFRKQAHKYHPDKGEGNEDAFKEVNEAYQVLSNPQKRKQYDQFGSTFDQAGFNGAQGPFGGSGFDFSGFSGGQGFADVDIDEIFGDFFGGFGGRARRSATSNKGRDLQIGITISFAEAALGVSRNVSIQRATTCDACEGSGARKDSDSKTCSTCNGSGQQAHVRQSFLGPIQTMSACSDCDGEGVIITEKCKKCSGKGAIHGEHTVTVDVPGGVENGQQLRLQGMGDVGNRKAPAGDLYVRITVTPDKQFKREGEVIYSEITIPFSVALLGDKIEIPTVDGMVNLKIPSGTQSGELMRLKNKGAYRLGTNKRGDHVVTVSVAVPKKMTAEQKKLAKKLQGVGL